MSFSPLHINNNNNIKNNKNDQYSEAATLVCSHQHISLEMYQHYLSWQKQYGYTFSFSFTFPISLGNTTLIHNGSHVYASSALIGYHLYFGNYLDYDATGWLYPVLHVKDYELPTIFGIVPHLFGTEPLFYRFKLTYVRRSSPALFCTVAEFLELFS